MVNGRYTINRLTLHLTGDTRVDRLEDKQDGFYELIDRRMDMQTVSCFRTKGCQSQTG